MYESVPEIMQNNVTGDRLNIYITPLAKQKFDLYIDLIEGEISGLGLVEVLGPSRFLITDLFLFKQESSAAETTICAKDLNKFMYQLSKDGRESDIPKLKLWWHSHGDLNVFWSSTDHEAIDSFPGDWMISLVGNKKGEYVLRYDHYSPIRIGLDNQVLQIMVPDDNDALREELKKEIQEKVSAPASNIKPFYLGGGRTRYSGYGSGIGGDNPEEYFKFAEETEEKTEKKIKNKIIRPKQKSVA